MIQLVYLFLRAFHIAPNYAVGFPEWCDLIPDKVLVKDWDAVIPELFIYNIGITILIFIGIIIYYWKFYRVTKSGSIAAIWWRGFWGVFITISLLDILFLSNNLINRDKVLVEWASTVPMSIFLVFDCWIITYVFILSGLFTKRPLIIKGALPPNCWFNKNKKSKKED
jgi:hypothetical protein